MERERRGRSAASRIPLRCATVASVSLSRAVTDVSLMQRGWCGKPPSLPSALRWGATFRRPKPKILERVVKGGKFIGATWSSCTRPALWLSWWCIRDTCVTSWWCIRDTHVTSWWCIRDTDVTSWWCIRDTYVAVTPTRVSPHVRHICHSITEYETHLSQHHRI